MGRRVRQALLLALYGFAVLAFFEISARAALAYKPFFRRVAGDDDASNRLRWIRRKDRAKLYYRFDVHHPTRGWALQPGLRSLLVFQDKRLSSNSRGVRGRTEYGSVKPAGRARILVFGEDRKSVV